ncbi:MAG TPA: Gfo/Idh/MocA family oxidoreductase, partial [Candidatus Saccharimonadales bacterium]|nr:Gfo/Idh/MocA family oxidoreductase [Candidatus Saccharimonadales bacterium]
GTTTEVVSTEKGAYQAFYAAIAASILDGTPLPVPVEDARTIIEIIEAAIRSDAEGRRITL